MKRPDRKYARFYYDDFIREYPGVYADDAALAAWLRLLTLAEKVWPTAPELPRSVRPVALRRLTEAGLVQVDGLCYRVRGLDAERLRRSGQAKAAADARWSAASNADSNAPSNAEFMPRRDKKEKSTPLPPTSGGRRIEGTNPRAIAAALTRQSEEAEKARRARRQQRYLAYSRGLITEAQRDDMNDRDADLAEIPTAVHA